jgi:hypothetical protein
MQALKERLSSKLNEKSKSKDKEGSSSLKNSSSVDGKHSTLHDSHQHQTAASSSSSSAGAANTTAASAQSAEKGIKFRNKEKENNQISLYISFLKKYFI